MEEVIEVRMPNNATGTKDVWRTSQINLIKGQEPYNIEKVLGTIKPEITFPQLLDVSSRLRRELALLLRSSHPRARKKKEAGEGTTPLTRQVKGPLRMTKAAEDSEVKCLYITAWSNGIEISNVLVDGGAMIELISKELVLRLRLISIQ